MGSGVVGEAHDRASVLGNIRSLVDRARTASVPVVWVQHEDDDLERGSDGWQLVPELQPASDDVRIEKRYGDSFEATDLDAMSDLWVHDDTVACTHPGWARLQGWAATSASFFAIFDQSPPLQVFVTDQRVHVAGDVAWVTLDENLKARMASES